MPINEISPGTSPDGANEAIAQLCSDIAAAIAYDLEDAFTRDLLKGCACEAPHFFEAAAKTDPPAISEPIYDAIAEPVQLAK